ncbi:MAG: exodeoxyribonuclease VII large subunit [Actinomycetota bacterium]
MLETSAEKPVPVRVVSEAISDYINRLGQIWVEGEIAQLNDRAGSGMVYMRLRDPSVDMYLEVTCPRSVIKSIAPLMENARVVINSKVNFYTPTGRLSLNAKEIRQVGVGELLARLEALKKLLAAEGLFAAERKKPLPFLPRKIGLICGRASAAEKDVKENAKRRWPSVQFETREVAVQGADAVIQVSAALKELDANPDVDVIIITRGGGSFEDLLPFSDEGLVRLAANCTKPIVSAIGHEQDTPLLDLVADLRASTPTDAAKRVVPDIKEELERIRQLRNRADQKINDRVILEMTKVVNLMQRSFASINSRIMRASDELNHMLNQVRALSPQATLDRGYAVVQKSDGSIVRTPTALARGEALRLRLAEGVALATATGESELDRIRGE